MITQNYLLLFNYFFRNEEPFQALCIIWFIRLI